MTATGLGTHMVCQIGLIVQDIEKSAQAYSEIFGLPKPDVRITDTVDVAKTAYRGASTSLIWAR
jgi:methylmalonyl-CoA/ethylmalonyl-CoA epimerase